MTLCNAFLQSVHYGTHSLIPKTLALVAVEQVIEASVIYR